MVPPSLTAGSKVNDPNRNAQHTQIRISYHLHMMAKYQISACTEPNIISALERVTVLPFTEAQPPMYTQDFSTEFVESLSRVIRTSLFGSTLGTLTVSTQEPPALVYNDFPFSGSSTALDFQIELDAAENGETYQRLRRLTFNIDGVIRIKTFFSATTFPCLPSQTLLTSQGKIRLLDEVVKLEPQSTSGFHWQYLQGAEQSRWRTIISIPIHIRPRLSPTFYSSLVARLYTLIIRLKVLNAYNRKPFELEVPVQVVYRPPHSEQATLGGARSFVQSRTPDVQNSSVAETDSYFTLSHMVRNFTCAWNGSLTGTYRRPKDPCRDTVRTDLRVVRWWNGFGTDTTIQELRKKEFVREKTMVFWRLHSPKYHLPYRVFSTENLLYRMADVLLWRNIVFAVEIYCLSKGYCTAG